MMFSSRYEKLTNIAAVFATVVGCLKIIGIISGVWIFTYFAQTLAISPTPNPYDRISIEDPLDVNVGQSFGCEDSWGHITWHRWNRFVRGNIPGPHRRGVTFLSYFSSITRNHSQFEDDRLNILTRYYFCNGGPISQSAGCPIDKPAVTISFLSPS